MINKRFDSGRATAAYIVMQYGYAKAAEELRDCIARERAAGRYDYDRGVEDYLRAARGSCLLDQIAEIPAFARKRSFTPLPGYAYDPNPTFGDFVESDDLLRRRFLDRHGYHSRPPLAQRAFPDDPSDEPEPSFRDHVVSYVAWALFAVGAVALALAWRSVAVQAFLDALRNAP